MRVNPTERYGILLRTVRVYLVLICGLAIVGRASLLRKQEPIYHQRRPLRRGREAAKQYAAGLYVSGSVPLGEFQKLLRDLPWEVQIPQRGSTKGGCHLCGWREGGEGGYAAAASLRQRGDTTCRSRDAGESWAGRRGGWGGHRGHARHGGGNAGDARGGGGGDLRHREIQRRRTGGSSCCGSSCSSRWLGGSAAARVPYCRGGLGPTNRPQVDGCEAVPQTTDP
mmetsp:Transcript_1906/g.4273  ORF Transcript_1906/g.4273 Transcript_1906/m.4273 type:complete len:225 (-) Transcript_1906:233-907(-)